MAAPIPAEYIDDPRFNKTFELPAHPPTRDKPIAIKYADYGYRNEAHPEEENVVLIFGPLMGCRLIHIAKEALAKRHKIRIIHPDRPGLAGSDNVPAPQRLTFWLDLIPALLAHLNIPHVSFACHSGGTVYALDMALHHPQLLHPERPYIAIGAPWIHPKHTSSMALSMAHMLPARAVAKLDKLSILINNHVGPVIGASFMFGKAAVAKLMPTPAPPSDEEAVEEDVRLEESLSSHIMKRLFDQGVHGASDDAVLFLHKVDGMTGWSDWGDYDVLVPRLAVVFRGLGRRLKVDVFYAETDLLIGGEDTKGPKWFDALWVGGGDQGDVFEFTSTNVKGVDHDTIWGLKWGVAQRVFGRVEGGRSAEDGNTDG